MPEAPPDLVVTNGPGGQTTVYASWNGATAVAAWDVLTGDAAGSLSVVASATRTGFETPIPVDNLLEFVAVRARDRAGRTIGSSAPIRSWT